MMRVVMPAPTTPWGCPDTKVQAFSIVKYCEYSG